MRYRPNHFVWNWSIKWAPYLKIRKNLKVVASWFYSIFIDNGPYWQKIASAEKYPLFKRRPFTIWRKVSFTRTDLFATSILCKNIVRHFEQFFTTWIISEEWNFSLVALRCDLSKNKNLYKILQRFFKKSLISFSKFTLWLMFYQQKSIFWTAKIVA